MEYLAAAGIPMILKNNEDHIVATQSLIKKFGIGILFNSIEDLCELLRNKERLEQIRNNVDAHRMCFSFDYHANDLYKV